MIMLARQNCILIYFVTKKKTEQKLEVAGDLPAYSENLAGYDKYFGYRCTVTYAGHLTGCGHADPHNLLTSASSA